MGSWNILNLKIKMAKNKMSSSISMKDIVCIMIIVILLVTLYYYFNNKFKILFGRTTDLNDRLISQKNLINEQSQMLSALNHETQMLKNFAKKTNEKFVPSSAVDNKNFNPKEYNLDTEISKELEELLNSEEEEVADINEFEDEKNSTSSFISCREFKGHRKGWIFKKGEKGTGYYLDKVENESNVEEEQSKVEEEKSKVDEEKPKVEEETWYYFIRQENNEEAIQKLKETIDSVNEPCYVDDMSVFYLDTENLVSAQTAKEMSKIDVNSYQFHRKYDGILKFDKISFKLKKKDKDKRKLEKIFDKLGYGKIDDYISDEDIDTDDLGSSSESESESDSDTGSGSGSGSVSESDDSSLKVLVPDKLPAGLKNRDIPNWARTKSKKRGEKK